MKAIFKIPPYFTTILDISHPTDRYFLALGVKNDIGFIESLEDYENLKVKSIYKMTFINQGYSSIQIGDDFKHLPVYVLEDID